MKNMAIIPRRPFFDLEDFFEEWPEWPAFDVEGTAMRSPRMDVYEEEGNLVAEVEMPGVDIEDVDVKIKDNVLRVEARREKEEEREEKGYYCKELSRGYYRRAVSLPVEVEDKKAEAKLKDGILKVIVPRVEREEIEEETGTDVKVKKG